MNSDNNGGPEKRWQQIFGYGACRVYFSSLVINFRPSRSNSPLPSGDEPLLPKKQTFEKQCWSEPKDQFNGFGSGSAPTPTSTSLRIKRGLFRHQIPLPVSQHNELCQQRKKSIKRTCDVLNYIFGDRSLSVTPILKNN